MCCISTPWVGRISSRLLDFWANRYLWASLTLVWSLVRSYNSTTNGSNSDRTASLISLGICMTASNVSVTSGKFNYVSQAVFFPWPLNNETVLHHVRAWETGTVLDIQGSIEETNWWTEMYLKLAPVSKATGSRGVTFVRKNYPSYMLPCKIHNLVILINKFAQCNLCESNLNSFHLVPYAVFLDLDLCARLVRHRSP